MREKYNFQTTQVTANYLKIQLLVTWDFFTIV